MTPQMAVIKIDGKDYSVSFAEGKRLVSALCERLIRMLDPTLDEDEPPAGQAAGPALVSTGSAAGKLAKGLLLGESEPVVLNVGEHEAVLEALGQLRGQPELPTRLEAVESALRSKIQP